MSLTTGDWKMNDNGAEKTLTIVSVDQNAGLFSGKIGDGGGVVGFTGLWNETSRIISFPSGHGFYKGYLFSTPRNPVPGQDVLWTLVGFVEIIDLPTAAANGGSARRNVFGWFAQISEIV